MAHPLPWGCPGRRLRSMATPSAVSSLVPPPRSLVRLPGARRQVRDAEASREAIGADCVVQRKSRLSGACRGHAAPSRNRLFWEFSGGRAFDARRCFGALLAVLARVAFVVQGLTAGLPQRA